MPEDWFASHTKNIASGRKLSTTFVIAGLQLDANRAMAGKICKPSLKELSSVQDSSKDQFQRGGYDGSEI